VHPFQVSGKKFSVCFTPTGTFAIKGDGTNPMFASSSPPTMLSNLALRNIPPIEGDASLFFPLRFGLSRFALCRRVVFCLGQHGCVLTSSLCDPYGSRFRVCTSPFLQILRDHFPLNFCCGRPALGTPQPSCQSIQFGCLFLHCASGFPLCPNCLSNGRICGAPPRYFLTGGANTPNNDLFWVRQALLLGPFPLLFSGIPPHFPSQRPAKTLLFLTIAFSPPFTAFPLSSAGARSFIFSFPDVEFPNHLQPFTNRSPELCRRPGFPPAPE